MKKTVKTRHKKELKCEICNQSGYSNKYKLNAHLYATHKAIPARFRCNYCNKEYFRSDEFTRHVSNHKRAKNSKQHYCDHCGRGFLDKRNLIAHLKIHDDLPMDVDRHFCTFCPASFCEARLLHYHIKKLHLNFEQDGSPIHLKKEINESWMEPVQNTRKFVEITKIKNNVLSIKRFQIKSQNKVMKINDKNDVYLKCKASLFAINNKHYSKVVCDYCKKEMLKKSIVKHIREKHLKLKQFHCFECNKSFNRNYQLCEHKCGGKRKKTTPLLN